MSKQSFFLIFGRYFFVDPNSQSIQFILSFNSSLFKDLNADQK